MIQLFEWMLYGTIVALWFVFIVFVAVYGGFWLMDWIDEKRRHK